MEPKFQNAFRAMVELEAGAIVNSDERQMVGHYWICALHPSSLFGPGDHLLVPSLVAIDVEELHLAKLLERERADIFQTEGGTRLQPLKTRVHGLIKKAAPTLVTTYSNGQGHWPVKSVQVLLGLLKNAESNAETKELDVYTLFISLCQAESDPRLLFMADHQVLAKAIEHDPAYSKAYSRLGLTYYTQENLLAAQQKLKEEASHRNAESRSSNTMPFNINLPQGMVNLFPAMFANIGSQFSREDGTTYEENGFSLFDWVGGRTLEISAVGLLSVALQGIDIKKMLTGVAMMDEATRVTSVKKNPVALLVLVGLDISGCAFVYASLGCNILFDVFNSSTVQNIHVYHALVPHQHSGRVSIFSWSCCYMTFLIFTHKVKVKDPTPLPHLRP